MHLPQKKVDGMKNHINLGISLTNKELPILSEMGTFALTGTGEVHVLRGERLQIHAWVNIDQLQAEGITSYIGFGKYGSEQSEKNGIYYKMVINETGEKNSIKGDITYNIASIKIDGVMYSIIKGSLLPNKTEITTSYKESYQGKSAKNSTIFKFFRKLVNNGLL